MLDLREAVTLRDLRGPIVQPAVADLLHAAANSAREVVMVPGFADQEGDLAVVAPEGVGVAGVSEALEVAVHGGEADTLEPGVQLLCGHRAVGRAQGVEDRLSLLGSPAHSRKR